MRKRPFLTIYGGSSSKSSLISEEALLPRYFLSEVFLVLAQCEEPKSGEGLSSPMKLVWKRVLREKVCLSVFEPGVLQDHLEWVRPSREAPAPKHPKVLGEVPARDGVLGEVLGRVLVLQCILGTLGASAFPSTSQSKLFLAGTSPSTSRLGLHFCRGSLHSSC